MKFSDDFLADVAAKNDIADVVGEYVRFTKRSGSHIFGLCPFHNEKTGSFSVNPAKQIYYCFGCHKGGGVINFIMEIENLRFPEAVEHLAKRAGIPLPESQDDDPIHRRKERMLELNRAAAHFWHDQLLSNNGGSAREYMAKRGMDSRTSTSFGLGFAPDSWNSLRNAMRAKGFTDFEMADAGLVKKGQKGGYYDAFRNRLIFPVINVKGEVIGFSGRIIGDGEPKYYNSPETLVFKKGSNLFALNLAKKSKSPYFILCEGNVDVFALHQAGFDSAIASLGTALTPEQAKLIANYKQEVIIAYDNDNAGRNATNKAIGIFRKCDVKIRVLQMRDAKDPDEYIKKFGSAAFQNLLDASGNDMDYLLNVLLEGYNLSIPEQKIEFVRKAAELVAHDSSPAAREVYAGRISELSGVSKNAMADEINSVIKRNARRARQQTTREGMTTKVSDVSGERFSDPESAAAEAGIIRLLLLDPELIKRRDLPPAEEFSADSYRNIYSEVVDRLKNGRSTNPDALSQELSGKEISMLIELREKPENTALADSTLTDYIKKVRKKSSDITDLQALMDNRRTEMA